MITTPPPCFGYYGKQTNCASCFWNEACRKVISKDRLKVLVKTVSEMKQILRGDENG
jgi:hypothetical protein